LQGENNLKIISKPTSKKKYIIKNLKILVNEILHDLKNEKSEFILFGNVKRINKIFFNNKHFTV